LGHISQSAKLWEMLQTVHLDHINPDTTTWSLQMMVATHQRWFTRFNLWGETTSMPSLMWKLWVPLSANCLRDWFFKIECGRRIDLSEKGGKIVVVASYVIKCKNPLHISSSNVSSPFVFGTFSRLGLTFMTLI
jgi:hypothetical protein